MCNGIKPMDAQGEIEDFADIQNKDVAVKRPTGQQCPHKEQTQRRLGNVKGHGTHHLP